MAKILVTGFKPFRNEIINPSEILLSELRKDFSTDVLTTLLLPVSYDKAYLTVQAHLLSQNSYHTILMLGQAGGRNEVCLERVALNWCESGADEEGQSLPVGPFLQNAPTALISDFFPTEWSDELSKVAPTAVSSTAGTFVCNNLYFKVLNEYKNKFRALFVHVPYLPEQTLNKPQKASMSLDQQKSVITELINKLLDFKN